MPKTRIREVCYLKSSPDEWESTYYPEYRCFGFWKAILINTKVTVGCTLREYGTQDEVVAQRAIHAHLKGKVQPTQQTTYKVYPND